MLNRIIQELSIKKKKYKFIYEYRFFMYEALSVEYFLLYLIFIGAYTVRYIISRSIPFEVFLTVGIASFFIFLLIPRKVTVCENGLFIGKFFIPWNKIEKITFSGNKISIKVKGYPFQTHIKRDSKIEKILRERGLNVR